MRIQNEAGEVDYSYHVFNGGEPHITVDYFIGDDVDIEVRLLDFECVGKLLCACDALKRMGKNLDCLTVLYFPAARQDRINHYGEALTVKVYADLINSLGFKEVVILDPHSDVTPALINNVEVVSGQWFVEKVVTELNVNYLVSPDAGAEKKVYKLGFNLGIDVVTCSKLRDTKTGRLSGFSVNSFTDLSKKSVLVVDDICDGGGTFLGIAKQLKVRGVKEMNLAVTHGIFSKGTDELLKHYKNIYTTDSFREQTKGVKTIKYGR